MKFIEKEKLIIRKSFKLNFRNGEFWGEELDSLSIHTDVVREKFLADLDAMKKPSNPAFIAINMHETLVDYELAVLMVGELSKITRPILKIVFVGLNRKTSKMFDTLLRKINHNFLYTFLFDYEKAKEWLIN